MHLSEDDASRCADSVRKSGAAALRRTGWQNFTQSSYNSTIPPPPLLLKCQRFQQNGTPDHTAQETRDWPRKHYGQRLMSRSEACPWPASSPDLALPDVFLWGDLKSQCRPRSPERCSKVGGARLRGPCAALQRRPRCAVLNCVWSEMGVMSNISRRAQAKWPWG